MKRKRVVFRAEILTHYRVAFHERVRDLLHHHEVDYVLRVGTPRGDEIAKMDTVELPWTQRMRSYAIGSRGKLLWQSGFSDLTADLLIVGQENRILSNYPLQALRRLLTAKVAYFGHGRNFQSRNPNSRAERWKRFWANKVDWWFAYTHQTKSHLIDLGYPPDQITVFENSVDTAEVQTLSAGLSASDVDRIRSEFDLNGRNIGIFVGGLYEDKRLDFLIDAAKRIRAGVHDFELVIVGGGPELSRLRRLAEGNDWIKIVGPRFGAEKVGLMSLGQIFLMPGLVGLAILDAATMGLPTITTDFPYHSPEIAYLEDGVNGMIVADWQDPAAYAAAVIDLLRDQAGLASMQDEARKLADRYSIEAMAERFANGVLEALARP